MAGRGEEEDQTSTRNHFTGQTPCLMSWSGGMGSVGEGGGEGFDPLSGRVSTPRAAQCCGQSTAGRRFTGPPTALFLSVLHTSLSSANRHLL